MNVGAVPPTSNRPMTVVPFDVMHHGLPIDRQGVPSPMLAFPRCGRASSNAKSKAPSVDCGKLAQSACLGGSSPSTTSELGRGQRFSVAIGAEFPAPKIVKTVSATRAVEELQRATERCCTIHARRIPQLPQANIGIRTGSQRGLARNTRHIGIDHHTREAGERREPRSEGCGEERRPKCLTATGGRSVGRRASSQAMAGCISRAAGRNGKVA